MKTLRLVMAAALVAGQAGFAAADGLCGVTGRDDLMATLAGDWTREGSVSLVNETTDILRASETYPVTILPEGAVTSRFLDSLTGAPVPLALLDVPAYDVDRVDDVLDSTARADLVDRLSDTLCGPEALPQVQAVLRITGDISVVGTITLIAYFDDRVLEITELQLQGDETVLFQTETALLTPRPPR